MIDFPGEVQRGGGRVSRRVEGSRCIGRQPERTAHRSAVNSARRESVELRISDQRRLRTRHDTRFEVSLASCPG